MGFLFHALLQHGRLHPQLGVLPVQPLHIRRHGTRVRVRLAQTLVEAAFQSELGHALLLLDHGAHFEQAIGGSNFGDSGRVSTAHNDAVFGLLEDLEVVGDDGAHLVAVVEEVLTIPELVGGLGAPVLAGKEGALRDIACNRFLNG